MRSRSQLIRVLQDTTQVAEYTYNGAGQRIKKVTQTETKIFHYDLRGHLIAETNQTGQMLAEYVYLGDQLLGMIKSGESVYYFHNDHLGTPQVLTDDSGSVVWKAAYTPFGEAQISIEVVENPHRFVGQYYDGETGLHYNYFRYYNLQTGRYITPDPIGLEGGINLFTYVRGNPLRWIDPWGLFVFASYDQATGKLYLYDLETGEGVFTEFHSGGPFGAPIPSGMYDILGHGGKQDFYRLEPVDIPYGDDIHQRTGRNEFRLHKPGGTIGCLTAKDWKEWRKAKSFIDQTKTLSVEVPSKWINPIKRWMHPTETLPWYGRIIVIHSE